MHTVNRTKVTNFLLVIHLTCLSFKLVLHYDIIFLTSLELNHHKIWTFSSELYCRFYAGYSRYYYYYYLRLLFKKKSKCCGLDWSSSGQKLVVVSYAHGDKNSSPPPKRQGISWICEELSSFQEELCSMELYHFIFTVQHFHQLTELKWIYFFLSLCILEVSRDHITWC
jgi:hypothetical protein